VQGQQQIAEAYTLYKTTVVHALQPRDAASRVHFCSWFLQSGEDEIDTQLTFFYDKTWFHLQEHINMNR
jgi:hypothetical protein